MTGPVARFARQIAGQGYIVAAPSSYHDFTGPEPLAYDVPGTDAGNEWKVKKASFKRQPLMSFLGECRLTNISRPCNRTMRTLTRLSTPFLASPRALGASALRACVLAAIWRCVLL